MKNFTDEKTLLREIKNGNGEAFEFLFNSYYPVAGICCSFCDG